MTAARVTLLHSVPRAAIKAVVRDGLKASSEFDDLGLAVRRGVVYCWLRREDDRMWGQNPDYVYVQVTVDSSRCRAADMDFSSIALMYRQGQGGRPRNAEAAALAAKLYEATSAPLTEYREGMFSTPEVLVKGDIAPEAITALPDN